MFEWEFSLSGNVSPGRTSVLRTQARLYVFRLAFGPIPRNRETLQRCWG